MKIVIIGGGIGGMALAILLHKKGYSVSVNEKETKVPNLGNAFLMHSEGVSVLDMFASYSTVKELPGKFIDTFILKNPNDTALKYLKLDPWQCIKRPDLINYLHSLLPANKIKSGRAFSHFLYEEEQVIAAVFNNGEVEFGDVFVGADGANSKVRTTLFGKTNFTPIEVKEIVGLVYLPIVAQSHSQEFTKFQSQEKGLSFGFIPTSNDEIVWFMQYDVTLMELVDESPISMRALCLALLKDFPAIVQEIIQANDFNTSYVWNTTDFNLLPTFHNQNVVLIGDAAHLAVPFTSAGTTNALIDAKVLYEKFTSETDLQNIFQNFYLERAKFVEEHTLLGRQIKQTFLDPKAAYIDELEIPLITHKASQNKLAPKYKKVHLLYFTDPVCSTCWLIQPQLRKLKLEYGDYLEIEYCMGGLLPSWNNFKSGPITSPETAAKYWDEVALEYEMPINSSVWLEDPLPSSYSPSIAFKAAQMQDIDKAIIFLRRINEMLFVDSKNIVENVLLLNAAFEAGLDAARLMRDLAGQAQLFFEADLQLAKSLQITSLPTFIFTDKYNHSVVLKGFQDYQKFEDALLQLIPKAQKKPIKKDFENLFKIYPTLTTKEFSFLSDLEMDASEALLLDLYNKKVLIKHKTQQKGAIWKLSE
jgi:2-polyprenyl-6-methoxyphenol hydroxylase-like FAD-dependent oxidoreductase/predicted DsbA family dithiol-disulfide isomerase